MAKLDSYGNLDYSQPDIVFDTPQPPTGGVRKPQPGDPDYVAPTQQPPPQQQPQGQGITDPTNGFPTGPLTSDSDPRLSNGAYATDPEVLKYINDVQGYGPAGNYQGKGPVAPPTTTTNNYSDPASWMALVGDKTKLTDWVKSKLGPNASPNDVDYYVGKITAQPGANAQEQGGGADFWTKIMQGGGAKEGGPDNPTNTAGPSTPGSSALSQFLMNWLSNPSTSSTANRSALMTRLMGLADSYGAPVTADDPVIKANTDAYHGQTARAVQNFRTMAAERAHAEGVGTGSFDSSIGNAEMSAGRSEAGFTGTLMSNELQSRRANLQSILGQASGLLSDQDRADLQAKISSIDGLLRGQSNDITASLGNKSLNNQNNQFYDKLGTDNAFSQEQLDYLYSTLGLK